MKHLFASCAVIALMAAPALAQSTYETTDPLVQTPESLDPTLREQPELPTEYQQEAGDVPQTEPVQEADADTETDTDTFADTVPSADGSLTADVLPEETSETVREAEMQDDTTTFAQGEPEFGTEMVADADTFETPIDVAELPEEYSTDDLNAMMLAQLNVVAEEIADANIEAGTNVYASTETYGAETDTAMNEWSPAEEVATEDYASTETYTTAEGETTMSEWAPADEVATEDYAATEPSSDEMTAAPEAYASVEPVDPAIEGDLAQPAGEAGILAEEADDSVQMADQTGSAMVTAEGDIDQTAVEIAAQDGRFTTLVELVELAGLQDALSLDGPYTVFAPTNEAFAALPEETLVHLKSEEGRAELVEILQAHVVEGAVMVGDVPMAGQELETIGDRSLNVTGSIDGSLNVSGSTTIGDGISASNGVVYAVDAVILPVIEDVPVRAEN
ncbi:MAG: fasciclin domain-containing protein [Hyphomonas sp.]